jgi:hypothetical protein
MKSKHHGAATDLAFAHFQHTRGFRDAAIHLPGMFPVHDLGGRFRKRNPCLHANQACMSEAAEITLLRSSLPPGGRRSSGERYISKVAIRNLR